MPDAFCLLSFESFPHYTHQFFRSYGSVCCPIVLLLSPRPHAGQSWRRKGSKPTLVHKLRRRQYDVFPISIRNFTTHPPRKQDRRARWPERVVCLFLFLFAIMCLRSSTESAKTFPLHPFYFSSKMFTQSSPGAICELLGIARVGLVSCLMGYWVRKAARQTKRRAHKKCLSASKQSFQSLRGIQFRRAQKSRRCN
jgi:hypothetical protein